MWRGQRRRGGGTKDVTAGAAGEEASDEGTEDIREGEWSRSGGISRPEVGRELQSRAGGRADTIHVSTVARSRYEHHNQGAAIITHLYESVLLYQYFCTPLARAGERWLVRDG